MEQTVQLKPVDNSNVWKIIKLSVKEEQRGFVASNTNSIIDAYVTVTANKVALPFGLYQDDTLVGFVMLGYGVVDEEDEPEIAKENYCLWRFMIDKSFQKQGLGKQAMQAVLDYIRTWPCGQAEYCWLSYEPENTVAKALYAAFGFEETGELCGDEVVAVCKLLEL